MMSSTAVWQIEDLSVRHENIRFFFHDRTWCKPRRDGEAMNKWAGERCVGRGPPNNDSQKLIAETAKSMCGQQHDN